MITFFFGFIIGANFGVVIAALIAADDREG